MDGLVDRLKADKVVKSDVVEKTMRLVDRKHYVQHNPYADSAQDIGHSATISAPHMHAMCLEVLKEHLKPGAKALDVGSGSGYLTACMGVMVGADGAAIGLEHIESLVQASQRNIAHDGKDILGSIHIYQTDGRRGYPTEGPYDAIHVGAATAEVPMTLVEQLAVGGRMVVPVGSYTQKLMQVDRTAVDKFSTKGLVGVSYVPLTSLKEQTRGYMH